MKLRIDKYLADMGVGTRSEVKSYLRKKMVLVNGVCPEGPGQKVDTAKDQVTFQGKPVGYVEKEYYLFHKPAGCVSAVRDDRYRTVIDYIEDKNRKDLFPVGRLDLDTEGLLFITNDGELSHRLLAPGKHVEKTYYARIAGRVTEEDIRLFREGLDIGEKKLTLPAELVILKSGEESEIELTITEGKYHQVKRMFEAVGKQVVYLRRISMGGITLPVELAPGAYRLLTVEEKQKLGITIEE